MTLVFFVYQSEILVRFYFLKSPVVCVLKVHEEIVHWYSFEKGCKI